MGEGVVDDVVQHDAAVGVDGVVDLGACSERGDHDGHFEFDDGGEVCVEAVVGTMHDEVNRVRRRGRAGMIDIVFGERFGDSGEPFAQCRVRAGVEGRKRSDDASRALGDH